MIGGPKPIDGREIDGRFDPHPPRGDQEERRREIRDAAKITAHRIVSMSPASREQSLAITALEDAVMWANKAIAREDE